MYTDVGRNAMYLDSVHRNRGNVSPPRHIDRSACENPKGAGNSYERHGKEDGRDFDDWLKADSEVSGNADRR